MLKNELLPSNLEEFKRRFGKFHDALIHHVQMDLYHSRRSLHPYRMTITLGTVDLSREKDRAVNLTFEIVDIKKFALAKNRNYGFSVVFGLNISFFEDEIFMDIFPGISNPSTPDDYYETNKQFERVSFFVVGKQCFWEISPYKERGEYGFLDTP